jgi:hypothetical protein
VADEMEAPIGVAARGDQVDGIGNQPIELIVLGVGRIGPGAGRIAALARRHHPVSGRRQGGHLRAPHMQRFRKSVQQQDQRRVGGAAGQCVEDQARRNLDLAQLGHRLLRVSATGRYLTRRLV